MHSRRTTCRRLAVAAAVLSLIVFLTRRRETVTEKDTHSKSQVDAEEELSDDRPYSNPHPYRYLIQPSDFCQDHSVKLLIMVASAHGHGDRRQAIRETWGKRTKNTENFRVLFLLGSNGEDHIGQANLYREATDNQDILQEDFKDTYLNLTLKTVMGLKWTAKFCNVAEFVMKTDDDIFVNVPLLLDALRNERNFSEKITGCIKNSPAATPQPFPVVSNPLGREPWRSPLPPFVAGAGYVLPNSDAVGAVRKLYAASLTATSAFPVEDVFVTAFCARRAGLAPPAHDRRFSCGQMVADDDCEMAFVFTAHKVTPQRMRQLMAVLDSGSCTQTKI